MGIPGFPFSPALPTLVVCPTNAPVWRAGLRSRLHAVSRGGPLTRPGMMWLLPVRRAQLENRCASPDRDLSQQGHNTPAWTSHFHLCPGAAPGLGGQPSALWPPGRARDQRPHGPPLAPPLDPCLCLEGAVACSAFAGLGHASVTLPRGDGTDPGLHRPGYPPMLSAGSLRSPLLLLGHELTLGGAIWDCWGHGSRAPGPHALWH